MQENGSSRHLFSPEPSLPPSPLPAKPPATSLALLCASATRRSIASPPPSRSRPCLDQPEPELPPPRSPSVGRLPHRRRPPPTADPQHRLHNLSPRAGAHEERSLERPAMPGRAGSDCIFPNSGADPAKAARMAAWRGVLRASRRRSMPRRPSQPRGHSPEPWTSVVQQRSIGRMLERRPAGRTAIDLNSCEYRERETVSSLEWIRQEATTG